MLQDIFAKPRCFVPAVHHHGPRVWRIASFHSSEESEKRSGVFWYPVVRPGGELELPHLSLFTGAILNMEMRAGNARCLCQTLESCDVVKLNNMKQNPYFEKCKCPDAVCGQLYCVQQRYLDEPVCFRPPRGPVLITFYLQWREMLR